MDRELETCTLLSCNNLVVLQSLSQGPRSNFWIEGAECLAFQVGEGAGATIEPPFLLHSFSVFVYFLSVFLELSCGCDVFMFIAGFFSFFISKYWKKYMYVFSTPIRLPTFAGFQSAFSQNHSQNVNEVLLT